MIAPYLSTWQLRYYIVRTPAHVNLSSHLISNLLHGLDTSLSYARVLPSSFLFYFLQFVRWKEREYIEVAMTCPLNVGPLGENWDPKNT